jgi:hypothetical protein
MTPWLVVQWCLAALALVFTLSVVVWGLKIIAKAVMRLFEYLWSGKP